MKVLVKNLKIENRGENIFNNDMRNFLSINKTYLVYAISIIQGYLYYHIYVNNKLLIIPSEMFEIIDNRVSKYWELKITDQAILFCPNVFLEKYFYDDLSEGVVEIVEKFMNIKQKIDIEFLL